MWKQGFKGGGKSEPEVKMTKHPGISNPLEKNMGHLIRWGMMA